MIKEIKNFKHLMVLEVNILLDLPVISETNTLTNTYNFQNILLNYMKIIFHLHFNFF